MSATLSLLHDNLESIILNPSLQPLLAIVKSARNGAVYGTKVRFPHALVMVFLFRSGTLREKLYLVFKATRQHASNLARFAVVYKTCMLILRLANPVHQGKEGPYDTLFAGATGGYLVFGRGKASERAVSQQIVIYVFARVMLAMAALAFESTDMTATTPTPTFWTQRLDEGTKRRVRDSAWPAFASISWALVMYVFRWQPESIQASLRSSMKYIYVNSDHWDSLTNFFIYNT